VQRLAEKRYQLFRNDPLHSSLRLKQVGESSECAHRVIGYRERNMFHWGWIGSHEAYNKLLRKEK
jgi:hypothetical protein